MKHLKHCCIILILPAILYFGCAKPHRIVSKTDYFSKLIFLPDSGRIKLCKTANDTIQFIRNLDFDATTDLVISNEGWIAGLDYQYNTGEYNDRFIKKDSIFIAKIDSNFNIKYYCPIVLKSNEDSSIYEEVHNIAVNGNILYVCGSLIKGFLQETDFAFTINLTMPGYKRTYIPIPQELKNKSIDAFLFKRDTVILVDDVEVPKYLIEYKNQDNKLEYIKTHELGVHGFNERILKAVNNDNYIVLLSNYKKITDCSVRILNANTYEEKEEFSFFFKDMKTNNISFIQDIYLTKHHGLIDVVVMALGRQGIGLWVFQEEYKLRSGSFIKPKTLDNVRKILFANDKMLIVSDGEHCEVISFGK